MKITLYLFHLILLSFILTISSSQKQSHIVKSLPGYPGDLPFTLETGYVGVGESEEVQLFYYFVESEGDVGTDPLMVWLTGGPGCSGFSGLIFEIGPLAFNLSESSLESDIPTLQQNPNSWTKVASIIFVDSPVGAGFSYATTSEAYHSDDTLQATHIYDFLRKWMIKHPKFKNNPFYVSGDSYSGITIPIIVQDIIQGNEIGLTPKLNLMGFVLGNPVTERDTDTNEVYEYAHRNSFLSDELYKSAKISCNGDFVNVDAENTNCLQKIQLIHRNLNSIKDVQVLEHKCSTYGSSKPVKKLSSYKYRKGHPVLVKEKICREYYYLLAPRWANDELVREALHIREGSIGDWSRCNRTIAYEPTVQSSIQYHMNISTKSLQGLIYSGDLDMHVPYVGTLRWINELKIPIGDDDWRPWFVDGQVAGYVTEFTSSPYRLSFTTIKGGSHTAAESKPRECRAMIERWLSLSPL